MAGSSWRRGAVSVSVLLVACAVFMPAWARALSFGGEVDVAPEAPGDQKNPSIVAAPTGAVYLAWDAAVEGVRQIFVARAPGVADPFGAAVQMTQGLAARSDPALAWAPGGPLVLAWVDASGGDADIFVAKAEGSWPAFTAPVEASDGPGPSAQTRPALVVGGDGAVHVAWEDERTDHDVRVASAPVGSLTFGGSVRVNDDLGNAWQHEPALDVDAQGILYAAWWDRRDVDPYVYVATSSDGGATFGANRRVTATAGPEFEPALAVHGGRVYAVWQDGRSGVGRDIYLASAATPDGSFEDGVRVNGGTGSSNQRAPSIAVAADGAISVVWEDFRNGVFEVYHAVSRDGGRTFEEGRVHQAPGAAFLEKPQPVVAVAGDGTVLVAWEDQRPADSRIAFVRSLAVAGPNGIDMGLVVILIIIVAGAVVVWALYRRKRGRDASGRPGLHRGGVRKRASR